MFSSAAMGMFHSCGGFNVVTDLISPPAAGFVICHVFFIIIIKSASLHLFEFSFSTLTHLRLKMLLYCFDL